jgi:Fur family transcriptional regulator, zinc uptake regulator
MPDHAKAETCHHHAAAKPTRKALAAAIASAKDRSHEQGVRWTAQRERALELLLDAGGPVKAYDLVPVFKSGATTAPPTIYRALETLVELGVAHRIPSLNAYTACHVDGEEHAASFLICDCCGGVEEMIPPTDAILAAIKAQSGFKTTSITVEARGRCARCQA